MANQPIGTVGVAVANVRGGPGTDYDIIAQASLGTVLNVVGQAADGEWLQVCCVDNQVGWLWHELLVLEGSTKGVPAVEPVAAAPAPAPEPAPATGWKAEYFTNPDLVGAPALVRHDPDIRFHLRGGQSPAPGIPGQNFSVRWTQEMELEAGDYSFHARADDGVRVKLDGWTVAEHWQVSHAEVYSGKFDQVGAGKHTVVVEFFQGGGDAVIEFWMERAGAGRVATSMTPAVAGSVDSGSVGPAIHKGPFLEWKGEYFNDIHLQGEPLLVRNDTDLNFDWGLGSPDPRVPADNWSARWTRHQFFKAGSYGFHARGSGGIRVYLDGWLVIDEWHDAPNNNASYDGRFDGVGEGKHTVKVEYYSRGGVAHFRFWWKKIG